tara:strand:- start:476 stop:751 length:276 start_codon:yes stop_codon:yes gene_type:complete
VKKIIKREKLGLIYDEQIRKIMFFQIYILFLYFKYFKNSKIEITKNNNPIILVSGQIAKDLKVGDKKIENEKIKSIFFSIFSNLNDRHLKK